jgi:Putative zinc-finger
MGPVTGDRCDHFHGLIALEVVGQLDEKDRLALSAHLDGCPTCRDERDSLLGLSKILPAADPDHLGAHDVPFELQGAVFDRLRRDARQYHHRRGARYVLGTLAAAVVALALVFGLTGSTPKSGPGHLVALTGQAGVTASARLTGEPWGTAIHLQETGQPGGEVLTVSMRSTGGSWWAAGTYRTVTGHTVRVDLACGVPASKISSIWVRDKGGQTVLKGYVA